MSNDFCSYIAVQIFCLDSTNALEYERLKLESQPSFHVNTGRSFKSNESYDYPLSTSVSDLGNCRAFSVEAFGNDSWIVARAIGNTANDTCVGALNGVQCEIMNGTEVIREYDGYQCTAPTQNYYATGYHDGYKVIVNCANDTVDCSIPGKITGTGNSKTCILPVSDKQIHYYVQDFCNRGPYMSWKLHCQDNVVHASYFLSDNCDDIPISTGEARTCQTFVVNSNYSVAFHWYIGRDNACENINDAPFVSKQRLKFVTLAAVFCCLWQVVHG